MPIIKETEIFKLSRFIDESQCNDIRFRKNVETDYTILSRISCFLEK